MVSLDGSLSKIENRESTRSVVRYARVSAHKARPVLNQIRNKSVGRADEILAFSERSVSDVISGCLHSAVANAGNNNGIPQEELFVSECFADEGPTLKRFRPRARGRATSIFKRSCHLTVVVSRYSEEELEAFQSRAELRDERKNLLSETDSEDEPKSKIRRLDPRKKILLRKILLRKILLRKILLRKILLRKILLRKILLRKILLRKILLRKKMMNKMKKRPTNGSKG